MYLQGKKLLYASVFGAVDSSATTSLFLSESSLETVQPQLPDREDLVRLSAVAQSLYPNSLHYQAWLALRLPEKELSDCKCVVFMLSSYTTVCSLINQLLLKFSLLEK